MIRLFFRSALRNRCSLRGFTLIELVIVMGIGGLVTMLTLGLLVKAREKSRQELCSDNLRQIIRGVRGYEETNGRFPPGRLMPDYAVNNFPQTGYSNYNTVQQIASHKTGFYSVHVWILPFVNAQKTYDLINFQVAQAKQLTTGGGQTPYNVNYHAYIRPMPLYLCPADGNTTGEGITENNYRYNFGGDTPAAGFGPRNIPEQGPTYFSGGNGAFTIGERGLESSAFVDGIAQTVFFSERTKGSGLNLSVEKPTHADMISMPNRGPGLIPVSFIFKNCGEYVPVPDSFNFSSMGRWLPKSDFSDGWPFAGYDSTQYNHVATPNWTGYDCGANSPISDTPTEHALVSARSEHAGGVNVAYGDGRVKFIKDHIALTPWRAFGTRNGGEMLQQAQQPQTQTQQQQGQNHQNQ